MEVEGSKKSHKEKSTQEPPGSSQALAAQTARKRDQNDSSYLLQQTAHLRFCRLKMWLKVTFRMKEALCYSSSQKPTASAPAHLSLSIQIWPSIKIWLYFIRKCLCLSFKDLVLAQCGKLGSDHKSRGVVIIRIRHKYVGQSQHTSGFFASRIYGINRIANCLYCN